MSKELRKLLCYLGIHNMKLINKESSLGGWSMGYYKCGRCKYESEHLITN